MKNILLIGVGGAGSKTVDVFYQKYNELGNQTDNNISAIVFDTDMADIKQITAATPVMMADPASVGTICDRLGKKYLREWFPCDDKAVRAGSLDPGAHGDEHLREVHDMGLARRVLYDSPPVGED